jgi:peptidoglycan hydrolase-like protein with peptidoglycan-binding domain
MTVTAVDGSGHTATATQTITVGSSGTITGTGNAAIQGLSPGTTVIVGQPVTFTVAASGFSTPVFSLSDSFGGSTVSNSAINSAGYFSWTPGTSDLGTHNITIYVNDSSGHTGNVTLSLTVNTPNISVTSINPGTSVLPNSTLSFTVSQAGFTNPSYTLSDSFSGTTITNSDINSSGYFSWTPTSGQMGSHTITIYATDAYGHSANTQVTISVNSGTSVTLTAPQPNSSVSAGTTVTLSAYSYGFTSPTYYAVQDSFPGSSLTGAALNASGGFSWTPTAADVGTHTITITVSDAYGHTGSAQTTITVAAGSGSTLSQLEAALAQAEAKLSQAEGSSSLTFSSYLSMGMTNAEVTQLQNVLEQQGYFSGTVSGYYGSLTEAAVKKFQAAHGIQQLGVVGPATREALNLIAGSASTNTASTSTSGGDGYVFSTFIGSGQQGDAVTELQKRLSSLGFYSGTITGYFGSQTRAAVVKFQAAHSLDQFGYVGPGTRAALNQ